MVKQFLFGSIFLCTSLFSVAQAWEQDILGKWKTKNEAVVEFYHCGKGICAKQLSAKREKDKGGVGKNVVKNFTNTGTNSFEGILYIPSRDAEHKAKWILSSDKKVLTVKVKWMFLSYQEDWHKL